MGRCSFWRINIPHCAIRSSADDLAEQKFGSGHQQNQKPRLAQGQRANKVTFPLENIFLSVAIFISRLDSHQKLINRVCIVSCSNRDRQIVQTSFVYAAGIPVDKRKFNFNFDFIQNALNRVEQTA